MDMTNFWDKYLKISDNVNAEDKCNQLKGLGFDGLIDPVQSEEFYNFLNRIMASFASHSRARILHSYKQGLKVGRMNMLSTTQKQIIKQDRYKPFVEVEPTDGNWDPEGFEDSFQGNSDNTIEDELIKLTQEEDRKVKVAK
ncbi:hypothetical protein M0R04_08975 [Candidatus Dojkabacteria bacterium]|jgi:hypothetical protein|nr:hypothetical protein [Candidatus Dojkabacteria bacterium]